MRVISGSARSLRLKTVKGTDTRPTTDRIKETLFNILSDRIYQSRFLDLFSGSGAIGIEALSRGASKAVFVERNRAAVQCINDNLKFTGLEGNSEVLLLDAAVAVRQLYDRRCCFDIIFMDPPYGQEYEKSIIELLCDCRLLSEEGIIIVEASADTAFDYMEDMDFEIYREKSYGSNKHIFIKKRR